MKATILGNDFNRIMDATKQFCRSGERTQYGYVRLDFDATTLKVTVMRYSCATEKAARSAVRGTSAMVAMQAQRAMPPG